MGWRFRKYIKIAPGVKLNISKSGVSTTLGGKGASINVGKNGAYLNTSIPGTGLYNRQRISMGKKSYRHSNMCNHQEKSNYSYFKIGNNWGCVFRWFGIFAFLCLISAVYKIVLGDFEYTEQNIFLLAFLTISVVLIFIKPIIGLVNSLFGKEEIQESVVKEETDAKPNKTKEALEEPTASINKKNDVPKPDVVVHRVKISHPDPLLEEAAKIIVKAQTSSTSLLQRKFAIGYNRADRLMNNLELIGLVGPAKGSKPREVLIHDEKTLNQILTIVFNSRNNPTGIIQESPKFSNAEDQIGKFTSASKDISSSSNKKKNNINHMKLQNRNIPNIGIADSLLEEVAEHIVECQECNSMDIQCAFAIGYNRVVQIMNQLEALKIIKQSTNFHYEVLIKNLYDLHKLFSNIQDPKKPDNIFGITEEYFNNTKDIVYSIVSLYNEITNDASLMNTVDSSLPPNFGSKEYKLAALFHADIMKVYQHFGHSTSNLKNREGFALVLLSSSMIGRDTEFNLSYDTVNYLRMVSDEVPSIFSSLSHAFDKYPDDRFFFVGQILSHCKREDLNIRYFHLLYRLFSIIAKADNTISEVEAKWLMFLMEFTVQTTKEKVNFVVDKVSALNATVYKADTDKVIPNPIDKLNNLIGLSNVKSEISSLSNLVKVQQVRKSRGMAVSNVSYHCVFTGNPGTGKTTVARIVANIYKQLGVLKKGHLVETDRSGLIAEYVGQTAIKTNAIIDSALDGVLFIDEAYSILQGGQNDYGKEAIATLLKRMEDDRDRLVVILAGYTKEMADFINANSGLQSRFNRYIEFPDYNNTELLQIFLSILKSNDCTATDEALALASEYINYNVEHKDQNFGNARFVRNLFERVLTQQANRLAVENTVTNEMLSTIEGIDVKRAIE